MAQRVIDSPWLPSLILLLSLSSLFVFDDNRGHFYRHGHHDWNSAHALALAVNLSPDNGFLAFQRQLVGADGDIVYMPYNSWPPTSFALTKLAILPFPEDFASSLYAARVLMLLFFGAAAILAYLALYRMTYSRWIALAATTLSFSSLYMLYYSDMIFVEMPVLFGTLLTFHGMVLFEQEGHLRQLLFKAGVAILLGWQVFALLLPFVLFGLASELWRTRPFGIRILVSLISSRYLLLGAFSFGLGLLVLSYSLIMDYYHGPSGEVPLMELTTLKRVVWRSSLGYEYLFPNQAQLVAFSNFVPEQLKRIGIATLPFALYDLINLSQPGVIPNSVGSTLPSMRAVGAGVLAVCLAGVVFVRYKVLITTLALFGFFWSLPLRQHAATHDFDSLFYGGIPLVFFSLALLSVRRRFGDRPIIVFSVVSAIIFILSSYQMNQWGRPADMARSAKEEYVISDFQAIRKIVGEDEIVYVPIREDNGTFSGAPFAVDYYLNGRPIEYAEIITVPVAALTNREQGRPGMADFIITRDRVDGPYLLTPDNRHIFLYRMADYERLYAELDNPIIESNYNVYLQDGYLIYTGSECSFAEGTMFSLHVYPVDMNDLPEHRRQYGFDHLDFPPNYPNSYSVRLSGQCVIKRRLPDYDFNRISTGEYTPDGQTWEGFSRTDSVR